jgi:uncharacterized protein with ParB-like and HNH nuclease domain
MENRVYYGEYSLKHWIELMLKGNIVLPQYQRYYVWNEKKLETLIETLKKKEFVPPITIGAFKDDHSNRNYILDGQQRLTSILLAYLELFPDAAVYKKAVEQFVNDNDDDDEDVNEVLDNVLEWTFHALTEKGRTKKTIHDAIVKGNYKSLQLNLDEEFLKNTFLGFSYLVPRVNDEKAQQKYYSSVFRNINIQGETLLPQESRASLYFLDKNLTTFFKPDFIGSFGIKNSSSEGKADFVRYLSLLSQFAKDTNSSRIARGYKPKMEKYYEEYIYSVVGESQSPIFKDFKEIYPNGEYNAKFELLEKNINELEIPHNYTSIIDLDLYFFGLIYLVAFKGKELDATKKDLLKNELNAKIAVLKGNPQHSKAPSALKYLKERIDSSISIFNKYLK